MERLRCVRTARGSVARARTSRCARQRCLKTTDCRTDTCSPPPPVWELILSPVPWVVVALLAAVPALTSCGADGAVGTTRPAAAVTAPVSVGPPESLTMTVTGSTASVRWMRPRVSTGNVTGFDLYLDNAPPVRLPASAESYEFVDLPEGSSHLVQIVTVADGDRSLTIAAQFNTPWSSATQAGASHATSASSSRAAPANIAGDSATPSSAARLSQRLGPRTQFP